MGVHGLLPVLKQIQHATTLESYRGKTLAIDTYAWLHKAIFSCSMELVLGKPTTAYINFFLKRLDMLAYFGITPYFVFDGDYLPTKGNTEKERERKRSEYKELALAALQKNDQKSAFGYFQKACDVSPDMAKSLIHIFKQRNINYVVAPYEADSQMVFLEKQGLVDGIISEDSDLLIFGCHLLITKLSETGDCIEIRRENFKKIKGSPIGQLNDSQLKLTAIVSGCDYTKGIPGVGMVKALSLVKRFSNMKRMIMGIKFDGKHQIPETFEEEYNKAILAFDHQIVFNPITGKTQHLNDLPEDSEHSKEYLYSCTGHVLDDETHKGVATGELDPFTKKELPCRDIYGSVNSDSIILTPMMRSKTVNIPVTASASMRSTKKVNYGTPAFGKSSTTLDKFLTPVSMRSKSCPSATNSSFSSVSSQKKSLNSIDRFFTKMPVKNEQQKAITSPNMRKLSPTLKKHHRLSPVAKRMKIMTHVAPSENPTLTASRFFSKNMSISEKLTQASQGKEDVWKSNEELEVEIINSSDCVLTDPDNDDDEDNEKETGNEVHHDGELAPKKPADVLADEDELDMSNKENDSSFLSSDIDEIVTPQVMENKVVRINSNLSSWKDKFEYKEMTPSKMIGELNFFPPKKLVKTPKRPALRASNEANIDHSSSKNDEPKIKLTETASAKSSPSFTTLTKQLRLDSFKYHA